MKCVVCQKKEAEKGFCHLHLKAANNLTEKYNLWKKAKNISWREYLDKIVKNQLTGEYAKEVAIYIIKKEKEQQCQEKQKEK